MKVTSEITDLDNDALLKLVNEALNEACERGLVHTLIVADENEPQSRHRYSTAFGCNPFENPDDRDATHLVITILSDQAEPNISILKTREPA